MTSGRFTLQLDAFNGRRTPRAVPAPQQPGTGWLYRSLLTGPVTQMGPPPPPELKDWRDPRVGWGLVLPNHRPLPECLRELVRARNASVLRYVPQDPDGATHLYSEREDRLVSMHLALYGLAKGALPYYLLIVASPEEIPWRLQYALSANRRIGRLDLSADGLDNYVASLLRDDPASQAVASEPQQGVIWATDHAPGDITHLMRRTLADTLHERYQDTPGIACTLLTGAGATSERLITDLAQRKPRLVVTTSHGNVASPDAGKPDQLGVMVDQNERPIDVTRLLAEWLPDGAIWYAHACCSAGSDAHSNFSGLFEADSENDRIISAVAGRGSMTAPLPQALLSRERPLRAFIGHVEPTFDLTLEHPADTVGAHALLVQALCDHLVYREPLGHAFRHWHASTGGLAAGYDAARQLANQGQDAEFAMFFFRLAFLDVQSTVILGDPAAVVWRS